MIHRTLIAFTITVTTSLGIIVTGGDALKASTEPETVAKTDQVSKQSVPDVYEVELQAQLSTKKVGSVKFWEAVSWCETNHDWNDGGYYAGGLGIAKSTWQSYGGKQFAETPSKATKTQQIIVANRIAFLGYQTKKVFLTLDDRLNNRPYFRPPSRNRSWGTDCVNWKHRKPNKKYTEAHRANS